MPLYEYRCKSCGHTFEAIQKFSDRPLRKCTECSGPLEKLISRNSFHLKGGGWFAGDYSNSKSASTTSKADSKSSAETKASGGCCGSGSCSH